MDPKRERALELIKTNIERSGFHIYLVGGGQSPRFAYTIGLRDSLGAELVLCGALYFDKQQILHMLHSVREQLANGRSSARDTAWASVIAVDGLGSFVLRRAHPTWSRGLLLGAMDYYRVRDIDAYQLVPDDEHRTIDVPDMTKEWTATSEPMWRWHHDDWEHPVPSGSSAMTNLAVLRGAKVTEAFRWEADYWEMFAGDGSEVREEDARIVPLGSLVAADPSLIPVVELPVGAGLMRDSETGEWTPWPRNTTSN